MPNKSQINKPITEPEIGNRGVDGSDATVPEVASATPAELALALQKSQEVIASLELKLANAQNQGSDNIDRLANLLAGALAPKAPVAPVVTDNINRSTDFTQQRATVDGKNMMEAQRALEMFRNETKYPISVSKSIANNVGTYLSITVNGVQVRIPCDGKTYYINETHWEHARERLAKIDALLAVTEPQIKPIS